jgi:coproporphyrinogen III oxidase
MRPSFSAYACITKFHKRDKCTVFCPRRFTSHRRQFAALVLQVGGHGWVGGGCDLTPNYLRHTEPGTGVVTSLCGDITDFHEHWKALCDRFSPTLYAESSSQCDAYFYIPCRKEHRGTGGIFFDDIPTGGGDFDAVELAEAVAGSFMASWAPIVQERAELRFSDEQRLWQRLRRGRYVECVLLVCIALPCWQEQFAV